MTRGRTSGAQKPSTRFDPLCPKRSSPIRWSEIINKKLLSPPSGSMQSYENAISGILVRDGVIFSYNFQTFFVWKSLFSKNLGKLLQQEFSGFMSYATFCLFFCCQIWAQKSWVDELCVPHCTNKFHKLFLKLVPKISGKLCGGKNSKFWK